MRFASKPDKTSPNSNNRVAPQVVVTTGDWVEGNGTSPETPEPYETTDMASYDEEQNGTSEGPVASVEVKVYDETGGGSVQSGSRSKSRRAWRRERRSSSGLRRRRRNA